MGQRKVVTVHTFSVLSICVARCQICQSSFSLTNWVEFFFFSGAMPRRLRASFLFQVSQKHVKMTLCKLSARTRIPRAWPASREPHNHPPTLTRIPSLEVWHSALWSQILCAKSSPFLTWLFPKKKWPTAIDTPPVIHLHDVLAVSEALSADGIGYFRYIKIQLDSEA